MTRHVRMVALLAAVSTTAACATIIHPERKGNHGGGVDVVPLVVDLLLFIPGLLPGVIAIAVDFGTGAIFVGGGSAQVPQVGRHGVLAVRARDLPSDADMALRLVDANGTVLDADWTGPVTQAPRRRLSVDLRTAALAHADEVDVPLTLEMQVGEGPTVRYALRMQ